MLDINMCRELLSNEKYKDIYVIFEDEYTSIFNELLKTRGQKTLVMLLLDMQNKFPEYKGTFKVLSEAFFNEKLLRAEKISFFLEAYPEVMKLYKKEMKSK